MAYLQPNLFFYGVVRMLIVEHEVGTCRVGVVQAILGHTVLMLLKRQRQWSFDKSIDYIVCGLSASPRPHICVSLRPLSSPRRFSTSHGDACVLGEPSALRENAPKTKIPYLTTQMMMSHAATMPSCVGWFASHGADGAFEF